MGTKQIRAMVAGAEVVEGQVPARGGEPQPLGSQGLPTGAVNGQQVVQANAVFRMVRLESSIGEH